MRFPTARTPGQQCLAMVSFTITTSGASARSFAVKMRPSSVITLKPAIRYQFKTGQRDWPET
jgi:hypothetical protein